ncbi:MAG TPA: hypothetical protein VED40_07675 [Azospirillaceae bacterium]|nr:hypothetical protein [Azospirillaceae bacterium]
MSAFRLVALLVLMAAAAGCTFRPQVTGMAVEYNEFVAEATNRQTVINILRARSREPLHFTSFSKVLGTARIEGTAGLDVAANGNGGEQTLQGGALATSRRTLGATNWTPKLGIKVNSGTDFEIGINATDDFWKGITAPVAPATIVHLLRQDWPRDVVSYLFIQRIEFAGRITDPAGKVVATLPLSRFVNAPDNEATVEPFTSLMRCRTLDYSLTETAKRDLPVGSVSDLSGVATDVLPRMTPAAPPAAGYNLVIPGRSEFTIALSERRAEEIGKKGRNEDCARLESILREDFLREAERRGLTLVGAPQQGAGTAPAASTDPIPGVPSYLLTPGAGATSSSGAGFTTSGYFRDLVPAGYKTELLVDVSLRSVEGLIYYLGEYVRESNKRPMVWGRCADGRYGECIPLIVVKRGDAAESIEPFISVDYKGERYVVPSTGEDIRSAAGHSSQVIALVQMMLNLYRSAKDLPSTPLVRVIN